MKGRGEKGEGEGSMGKERRAIGKERGGGKGGEEVG